MSVVRTIHISVVGTVLLDLTEDVINDRNATTLGRHSPLSGRDDLIDRTPLVHRTPCLQMLGLLSTVLDMFLGCDVLHVVRFELVTAQQGGMYQVKQVRGAGEAAI